LYRFTESDTMRKRLLLAAAMILATGSCATPKFQAALATEMRAAADEIMAQRQDMMLMQEQIDSLKFAMARQDTIIRKLANLAGVPVS
jgi:uncharacterized protein HemX